MADRYPDQGRGYESRGRSDGRSSRWGDDQGGRGRQFGQSRTSRFEDEDNDYARHFDQDRDESRGVGGYGGGYGQGISGQTYGGGYNDRRADQGRYAQDWDRHDDQMWGRDYFQGQGSYAQDGEGYGQSFGQGGYAGGRSYSDQNFGQGSGRRGGTYGGQWGRPVTTRAIARHERREWEGNKATSPAVGASNGANMPAVGPRTTHGPMIAFATTSTIGSPTTPNLTRPRSR